MFEKDSQETCQMRRRREQTMTQETEKIIDKMIAHAKEAAKGTVGRYKMRALLRRRVIEAVEFQFKEGLELSDLGALLPPEIMIELIANPKPLFEKTAKKIRL